MTAPYAIENHRLIGENVSWQPDNSPGLLKDAPRFIAIHYSGASNAKATADFLDTSPYSCHLSVCHKQIIQQVAFDRIALHAGKSVWRGRERCNEFSIGIEIGNPGPLVRRGDKFFTVIGNYEWKKAVLDAGEIVNGYRYWAAYADSEIDIVVQICDLLKVTYPTIVDARGHSEIAPGRKIDPGPAFPMRYLREALHFPKS